jgi:hypothetical protein
MVIKASASAEIRTLVEALGADDDVQRDAAVARLGVIGARAIDRLTDAYAKTTHRGTHLAILRTLEVIADHRSAPLAQQALAEGGDIAVTATAVLRALLASSHAATAAAALDGLVATTLDVSRDRRLRLAAFDALFDVLRELPPDLRARVTDALRSNAARGTSDVADLMTMADREAARAEAVWKDAVEGRLPEAPEELREALATRGASAPLNTLRALVDAVHARERETRADDGAAPHGWLALRGALHQALALRGSRLALYDLRETIEERAARLPPSFLAALHVLGDVSCLEPLAAAWASAGADRTADAARWRHQLASAFKAVAEREKITKRHAVMKRIAARWPGLMT